MEKTEKETKEVGWASNPRFDIDVGEVLSPFNEINEVSNMFDFSDHHFVDIKRNSQAHHSDNGQIPYFFILHVEEQKQHRKDKNLHIVLEIPSPRNAHMLSIIDQIVNKQQGLPGSSAIWYLT